MPPNPEPTVTYTVREMFDKIDGRLDGLEKSAMEAAEAARAATTAAAGAARQDTVKSARRAARLSVALSIVTGPGAAILTWLLTHHP